MKNVAWLLAVIASIGFYSCGPNALVNAQEAPLTVSDSSWHDPAVIPTSYFQGDGRDAYEENDDAGEPEGGPEHIRDNAFLVEEAFNQEPGEVQHVFNWVRQWEHYAGGQARDFAFSYTMEIPLGSQKHQFSFTSQFFSFFERETGQPAEHQGGVGDMFLSYRYQLLDSDEFLWCAPRATLIVPTGDQYYGLGTGAVGYQFNLPISHYDDNFDFHFNAGYTTIPGAQSFVGVAVPFIEHDLGGINLGGSVFWKPRVDLNFFVESLVLWVDEVDTVGDKINTTQAYLNPGMRYAVCQFDEVEWVLGVSVPVGLTADTPDIGVFAYMSIEHLFRKVDK